MAAELFQSLSTRNPSEPRERIGNELVLGLRSEITF